MPFIRCRDLDLYFERHGTAGADGVGTGAAAVPVLWINGTGGDLRENPIRGKGPLERAFDTVMYDQRGLGQTTAPDGPYTMADYADDAAALLDALGIERCHVIGVSFGGMVAQELVLRHPQRVNRLVLACTSSGGAGGSSFDLLSLQGLRGDEYLRAWMPVMDTRNDPTTTPMTIAPGLGPIVERIASRPAQNADRAKGARLQLEARAGHNTWGRIGRIASPTLVIGGRYDAQAPPENLERLASQIPDSQLVFCAGGHIFLLQDRTAWPTIVGFLQR